MAPMRSRQPSPAQWDAMSLEGPAVLTIQATWLASRRAEALGYDAVTRELLLLGVLEDVRTPWPRCMSNPWVRQLKASVGLPAGYQGAAGALLTALGVDLEELRGAVSAALPVPVS